MMYLAIGLIVGTLIGAAAALWWERRPLDLGSDRRVRILLRGTVRAKDEDSVRAALERLVRFRVFGLRIVADDMGPVAKDATLRPNSVRQPQGMS